MAFERAYAGRKFNRKVDGVPMMREHINVQKSAKLSWHGH